MVSVPTNNAPHGEHSGTNPCYRPYSTFWVRIKALSHCKKARFSLQRAGKSLKLVNDVEPSVAGCFQSPVPGSGSNSVILPDLPSQSLASSGASFFTVMLGQDFAYSALSELTPNLGDERGQAAAV